MWAPGLIGGMPEHDDTLRRTDCGECSSMLQAQFRAGESFKSQPANRKSDAILLCSELAMPSGMIIRIQFLQHIRDMGHRENCLFVLAVTALDSGGDHLHCDTCHGHTIGDFLFQIAKCLGVELVDFAFRTVYQAAESRRCCRSLPALPLGFLPKIIRPGDG